MTKRLKMQRRNFLKLILGATTALLLEPLNALAALWSKSAFETTKIKEATQLLGIHDEISSIDIQIIAPDRAENGAVVQVEIKSNLANTDAIYIFVEKNPTPLIAHFLFSADTETSLVTRIKMAETSDIKVVVKAGAQFFTRSKNVIVLENGCG
jgi:sulfur-oxidizing protein SoxY